MDSELNLMLENHKLDQLYNNNLFSVKSMSQLLGTWDNYSIDEKYQLENITKRDTLINKCFTFNGSYQSNLTYGEITRTGVDIILEKISTYKKITDKDVFVDVGSGTGKLLIHSAIKSNFKTFVGIEIQKERLQYSKIIKENILPEKPIFFINKDALDFDLSIGTVFFMNDVTFGIDLRNKIFNKLPKGSHFITFAYRPECKILKEEIDIPVTWSDKPVKYKYYIK
jgi:hypothetical protein